MTVGESRHAMWKLALDRSLFLGDVAIAAFILCEGDGPSNDKWISREHYYSLAKQMIEAQRLAA